MAEDLGKLIRSLFDRLPWNNKKIFNISFNDFKSIRMLDASDSTINELSTLYSNNYGQWADSLKKVKYSIRKYKEEMQKEDYYLTYVEYQENLVGFVIYLRRSYNNKYITWVQQLVVDKKYRNNRIGTILLYSSWGMSTDFAWGLATVNPFTVMALEKATGRKCNPITIKKNINALRMIIDDVGYCKFKDVEVAKRKSVANTKFYIVKKPSSDSNMMEITKRLGTLKNGYEWFAFTFNTQTPKLSKNELFELLLYSDMYVKHAYSRMQIDTHGWAKYPNEIEYIINTYKMKQFDRILDAGCGTGRHSKYLYDKGFTNILGVDFSATHIAKAKEKCPKLQFEKHDLRYPLQRNEYDVVFALYDVIGTFADDKENEKIIDNIIKVTAKGGLIVVSVMNIDYTLCRAKTIIEDIYKNIDKLFHLMPSRAMQKTGDVFDSNYMIVDTKNKIIYRKEIFENDGKLPVEFIVRDRRYHLNEIKLIFQNKGLDVLDSKYVKAGDFSSEFSKTDAKEILIICRKK